jgi:HlyD family secretion protein
MQNLLSYLKKWWVITGLIIVALIVLFMSTRQAVAQYTYVTVSPTTVSEGVSVTGKVSSADAVDLAFVKSGKIAIVNKNVGQRVEPGEIIVALDNADIRAQLAQSQAQVAVQQAKLNELEKGTRPEQLIITRAKLESARTDFVQAELGLLSALQNAYSGTEDAIHNKADQFFINPRSGNPQLSFAQTITSATSIESGRVQVELKLNDMQNLLTQASTSSNLPALSNAIKHDIAEAKLFLDNTAFSVNALVSTTYLTQTTVSGWKADLAAARNEVNSAITTILTADKTYSNARSALAVAEGQLDLERAGSVTEDIEAQRAQVDSARATVASLNAQVSQTYIRSPLSGVVTKQDGKIGEIAPLGTPLVSVISDSKFQIEANIAEADIAKIQPGQKADVTLDAYGSGVMFKATVIQVNPAETVIDGVPTYKTTFQFDTPDDRIKSGMTANIDIQGQSHINVLAVPERAIVNREGGKFVRVKIGEKVQEVRVITGLRGEDGKVEIVNGLHDGDSIALSNITS